jgi:hypothetical protein
MKELIWMLMEKLLGKDLIHTKVNIQLGVIIFMAVLMIGGSAVAAWKCHAFYWRWNELNNKVNAVPGDISNAVTTVEYHVDDHVDAGQQAVLKQLSQMEDDARTRDRKLDRIDDYIFDKEGVKLDFNGQQSTNQYEFEQ